MLRHKLHFGPYRTPLFRYGQRVQDELRGLVRIVGSTAGLIPWPIGRQGRSKAIVLYKGLARAVRREAAAAVMHAWNVGPATVNKWRRALGVARWNEGDVLIKAANGKRNKTGIAAMHATARDPERCAKIAAARRGRRRPSEVVEGIRRRMVGKRLSATTRKKMSEAGSGTAEDSLTTMLSIDQAASPPPCAVERHARQVRPSRPEYNVLEVGQTSRTIGNAV
jgi:hypothetical protein